MTLSLHQFLWVWVSQSVSQSVRTSIHPSIHPSRWHHSNCCHFSESTFLLRREWWLPTSDVCSPNFWRTANSSSSEIKPSKLLSNISNTSCSSCSGSTVSLLEKIFTNSSKSIVPDSEKYQFYVWLFIFRYTVMCHHSLDEIKIKSDIRKCTSSHFRWCILLLL